MTFVENKFILISLLLSWPKDDVLGGNDLKFGEWTMTKEGCMEELTEEFKKLDEELGKIDGPFFAGNEVVNYSLLHDTLAISSHR